MTSIAEDFIENSPAGTGRVLQMLAVAESLTDDVAMQLYELNPIPGVPAQLFVQALHYSDIVEPRNSEWHFTNEFRESLRHITDEDDELVNAAHDRLLSIGQNADVSLGGDTVPRYLFSKGGMAYHKAAIGLTDEALRLYAQAAIGPLSGDQWLASHLASEQETDGVLPEQQIEVKFLRAMVLYREGDWEEAKPLLFEIARTREFRIEVAIASNILGVRFSRSQPRLAERLLKQSVQIGEWLGDRSHLAQSLHVLANLVARVPSRADEAEALYKRSLSLEEELNDSDGIAQTLHSFGNFLARQQHRGHEAEAAYRRSIDIEKSSGSLAGLAQTYHSLGNLLRKNGRYDESELYLRNSLKLGERFMNLQHQAQVLRTLSFVVERTSVLEAERMLRESLRLNEIARNAYGVRKAMESLEDLYFRHGRPLLGS
ncbi:tetratricopeptide repeat protein [Burkholderia vietnamiensis]|uniref:tetratricopeptide repeat protein n=1 Tax=Burkholderia vietnamiensis TaxID=60552 RepID=UPI001B9CB803|nr:tetratricopeptide repeat protein [Burkholderia vietnamiensis]MBR7918267.1 tetratricopeptide repeat protein [Burkholderia vietnamiensis]